MSTLINYSLDLGCADEILMELIAFANENTEHFRTLSSAEGNNELVDVSLGCGICVCCGAELPLQG